MDQMTLGAVLASMYQGSAEEFAKRRVQDGLSYYNPVDIVSFHSWLFRFTLRSFNINPLHVG
jgi:hypothetical protein